MEYTQAEQRVLDILGKTDFRHVSKDDVVGYVSMLQNLQPEAASKVIEQYPQLIKLISDVLVENRNACIQIIKSDDRSTDQCYDIYKKVQADLSKCLDKDISAEERASILKQEMEIARMASDLEISHGNMVWKYIRLESLVTILVIGIGAAALGGKFNLKLPQIISKPH